MTDADQTLVNGPVLHILEGPAGSGKTYLSAQIEALGFPVYRSSLPWRFPPPDAAPLASAQNDFYKLSSAVFGLYASDRFVPIAVIDRCCLSQWVYKQLRLRSCSDPTIKRQNPSPGEVLAQLSELIAVTRREALLRAEHAVRLADCPISTVIWLMLPQLEVLDARRAQGRMEWKRKYPWPGQAERALYCEFAEVAMLPSDITIRVIDSPDAEGEVIRAFVTLASLEKKLEDCNEVRR